MLTISSKPEQKSAAAYRAQQMLPSYTKHDKNLLLEGEYLREDALPNIIPIIIFSSPKMAVPSY